VETPASYDSKTLIQFAWIGVIALGIVAAAFTSTILYAVKKAPADKNPSYTLITWLEHAVTLHMMTVILIVVATSLLGLFGIIKDNGVVGILSGIAGYVLGGLKKESATPPSKPVSV
jgi:uncharacterized membrane protein